MKAISRLGMSLVLVAALMGCKEKEQPVVTDQTLPAVKQLSVERIGRTNSVKLTWEYDTPEGFDSFEILMKDPEQIQKVNILKTIYDSEVREYLIEDVLQTGHNYYLGVKVNAKVISNTSKAEYIIFYLEDLSHLPVALLNTTDVVVTPASVGLKYRFEKAGTKSDWGLCWSADHTPTIEDAHAHGPIITDAAKDVFQAISNASLDYGKTYKVRAYVKTQFGVTYSDAEASVSLGAEPKPIVLNWNKIQQTGLPEGVEVYSTTDKLNGRVFAAWYAIADVSKGNVEFRVNVPSSAATLEKQYTSDNIVLTNAGYFYNGRHTGIAVINGTRSGNVSAVRGTLSPATDPEYNIMYNVTRGCFGVDSNQKPAVYWVATDAALKHMYFDYPMTSVKGLDKYETAAASYPVQAADWNPKYAVSAGPVLLKDGKIPFDMTVTPSGSNFFYSNFEIIPDDIYMTHPDRTCVGYTADGKIILFVCDGRIKSSDGATLVETAQIMKGLGCVEACNFDGGGSTAMLLNGQRLNSLESNTSGGTENRAVVSTMGFYRK